MGAAGAKAARGGIGMGATGGGVCGAPAMTTVLVPLGVRRSRSLARIRTDGWAASGPGVCCALALAAHRSANAMNNPVFIV